MGVALTRHLPADEPGNGLGRFVDPLVRHGTALLRGCDDAATQVLIKQQHSRRPQRLIGSDDLGEHIDAVRTLVDHSSDPTQLTLDAVKAHREILPWDSHRAPPPAPVQAVTNSAGFAWKDLAQCAEQKW